MAKLVWLMPLGGVPGIASRKLVPYLLGLALMLAVLPVNGEIAQGTGVVVESVGAGSALEKAGIRAGDVLLSWKRLPNPPANPEAADGVLTSYFDWLELQVEQAPRGTFVLGGRRDSEPKVFTVGPGLWKGEVRPGLPRALEEIYSVGKAHLVSGDVEAAERVWRSLADRLRAKGSGDLQVWIAIRIGEAWGEEGEWGNALESFRDALEAAESPSGQIAAWQALGQAHRRRNELEAAEDAYVSALEIRQKLNPESLGVAYSLTNVGSVTRARGELDRAHDYHLRALQIREKLAPQSLANATSLNNLGVVSWARGELDRAHDYYLQALQIQEQLAPQNLVVAASLNNLGIVAHNRGELNRAHDYHLGALQIREKLAPKSLVVAASLNNLGLVARARGELDRAHDYQFRALQIREKRAPKSPDMAVSLNNLGTVARARGELDRAHDYHLRALQIREQLAPNSLGVAASLNNLGTVAHDRGELERAYDYYLRTLQIEEQLAPESLIVAMSLNNLGTVARARGDLERAHDYHIRALQIKEQLVPQSLTVANSLGNLGLVAQVRGQLDRAQDYYLRALRIQEQLAPKSLDVATNLNNLGTVARARGELDRALEHYSRGLEALEHQVSKLGGSYNVQGGFRTQHGDYYHDMLDLLFNQERFVEAFHVVERCRAQTFLTMLAERDTAFTTDVPEEFDRERRRLTVRYDRTLKRLAALNPRDHSEAIETTRQELEKLHDEAGDLEARIRWASPRHLPMSSFVALTIPEDLAPDQDNGLLQVWEIFERVRIDADLVVLSACESGLGQELGGEGLIGLTRAFQYAGARSVAASLWSVPDQTTAELMIRFYRHLRSGLPKDEALRAAQLELIRGPIEVTGADGQKVQKDASAPYYWAAFQIYGDWK
ncbi:MAG: tetratricopeptide repeat protein [bacterium]|nr:tetratricopeptide repeat protein [bacterium]